MVSLSVMGIVARAREKFFRAPRLRRMLLFHELINLPQNYVMIPICYRNSRTVPIYFFTGALYTGNLIPIISIIITVAVI